MFRQISALFAALARALRSSFAMHPAVFSFSPHDEARAYQAERAF